VDSFDDDPELLEAGRPVPVGRSSTIWVVAAVVTCLLCLLVGYAAGHHSRARQAAPPIVHPTSFPSVAVGGPALAQTGGVCSVQHGRRLQLGVQVQNQGPSLVRSARGSRSCEVGMDPRTLRA
jgi:hypothetical protein